LLSVFEGGRRGGERNFLPGTFKGGGMIDDSLPDVRKRGGKKRKRRTPPKFRKGERSGRRSSPNKSDHEKKRKKHSFPYLDSLVHERKRPALTPFSSEGGRKKKGTCFPSPYGRGAKKKKIYCRVRQAFWGEGGGSTKNGRSTNFLGKGEKKSGKKKG